MCGHVLRELILPLCLQHKGSRAPDHSRIDWEPGGAPSEDDLQEELLALLEKDRIEYDPKYLWE